MHSPLLLGPVLSSQVAGPLQQPLGNAKPQLISYDSSQEFSYEHLINVCKLVEREDHELDGYVFDDECLGIS